MKKKIFLLPMLALLLAGCGVPNPTSVEITGAATVEVEQSIDLVAKVLPEKASQEVIWSTSAPEIATVTAAGKVTGIAEGAVKITAASKAKVEISSFVDITVTQKSIAEQLVESVAITTPNGVSVEVGSTLVLGKTVLPAGANQSVTWNSSDKSVATVDNGTVTAMKAGTSEISIVSVADATKTAKVEVTVTEEAVIKLYTVTFDSDGGSEVAPAKVNEGGKVTKPADPTKDGFEFVEWQLADVAYDFDAAVVANITLKAVWDVVVVKEGLLLDFDAANMFGVTTGKPGEDYPDATYVHEGITYKFALTAVRYLSNTYGKGAYEDYNYLYLTKDTGSISGTAPEGKYVAELEAYYGAGNGAYGVSVVTFTGGDGEDIVANEPAGKAVAVISTNTNKSHNQFSLLATGGNLQLQSLRIVYGDAEGVTPVTKHTVTFDSDGGSEVAPVKVNEGGKVTKPADPTKDGFEFVEWQLADVAYDFDAAVVANITLKAVWDVVVVKEGLLLDFDAANMFGVTTGKPGEDYPDATYVHEGITYKFALTAVRYLSNTYGKGAYEDYNYLYLTKDTGSISGTAPEGKYIARIEVYYGAGNGANGVSVVTFSGGSGEDVTHRNMVVAATTAIAINTDKTHNQF